MKKWIEETDIGKIWLQSIGGGLGFLLVGAFIGRSIFYESPPKIFIIFLFCLAGFVFILPGFAQIMKQESPGGIKGIIKGRLAVISGWIWVIFCSSILLGIVYDLVASSLK